MYVTKFRSRLGDDMIDNLCVLRGVFLEEKKELLKEKGPAEK